MEKLDLTKTYKNYYSANTNPELVKFGEIAYLSITGKGEPAGKEFSEKAGVIYPVAYGIKKICKNNNQDFGVPKLEGLWWVNSAKPALSVSRSEWFWKLLIRMPDYVTAEIVAAAITEVIFKKKSSVINEVRFETINEGSSVSMLHQGPYSAEVDSIKLMDQFIEENGYIRNGHHHEIYLSDPNKTAADKLKTILRQPVK